MAAKTQEDVEAMVKSLRFFREDMMRIEKASGEIATNFTELAWQAKFGQRNLHDYIGEAIRLPAPFREVSFLLKHSREELTKTVEKQKELLRRAEETGDKEAEQLRKVFNLQTARLELQTRVRALTGKQLGLEFLMIKGFQEAIKRSGEVNEAIISANSAYEIRKDLTDKIYETQIKTGASMQQTTAAARALASVWPKARPDFQSTLEVMIQMERGLGVSYENSAQLARVFELSLKIPVQEVADQIAIIANNTSLAADEAARFAIEIGKAVRRLGPDTASGAAEVVKRVTLLAARMKDVGGDADEIVKTFTEMSKGTPQAFMLRAFAGVSPGQLQTGAGSETAFRGLGRFLNSIVTAREGTNAWTVQLEIASQILGMNTDSVALYQKMLKEANKPLDEHAKLLQRWREQTEQANQALGRIFNSIVALVQRAFLPAMPYITKFLGGIADFIAKIAAHQTTATLAFIGFIGGLTYTGFQLYRLTAALIAVSLAAKNAALSLIMQAGQTQVQALTGGVSAGAGKAVKSLIFLPPGAEFKLGKEIVAATERAAPASLGFLQKIAGFTGGIFSFLKTPASWGMFLKAGPLAAIAASAAAGWTIGKIIEKRWPDNWVAQLAYSVGKATIKQPTMAVGQVKAGQKPVWEVLAETQRALVRGDQKEAQAVILRNLNYIKGTQSPEHYAAIAKQFEVLETRMRERRGLTLSVRSAADEKRDAQDQLNLQKEAVKNLGTGVDLQRRAITQENARYEAIHAENARDKMLAEARFRLLIDPTAPRKAVLEAENAPAGAGGIW